MCFCLLYFFLLYFFFFFKQKTAYEMLRSLVGSEMCIRDRFSIVGRARPGLFDRSEWQAIAVRHGPEWDVPAA